MLQFVDCSSSSNCLPHCAYSGSVVSAGFIVDADVVSSPAVLADIETVAVLLLLLLLL
jgi:hypothetical protein